VPYFLLWQFFEEHFELIAIKDFFLFKSRWRNAKPLFERAAEVRDVLEATLESGFTDGSIPIAQKV
jgi:hypothetical protein